MKFKKALNEAAPIEVVNTGNAGHGGKAAISFRIKTSTGKSTEPMGINDLRTKYPREAELLRKVMQSPDWGSFLPTVRADDPSSWDIVANAADEIILTKDDGAIFLKYKVKDDGTVARMATPLTAAQKAVALIKSKSF